jgi:cell shape-determining protein MreD
MENESSITDYIFAAIFVMFYQVVLAFRIGFGGAQADVAAIITIWLALTRGPHVALIFGLVIGFLVGLLTPMELGWSSLLLVFAGYFTGILRSKFAIEPMPSRILTLVIVMFVYNLLYYFFVHFELLLFNFGFALTNIVSSTINSVFVGIILFIILRYRFILRKLF